MNLSQDIVAYEGRPTSVVESILSQVVSSGTQVNYANHNVDLILWIYEREEWREELLRYSMVERLISAEDNRKNETHANCKYALEEVKKSTTTAPLY